MTGRAEDGPTVVLVVDDDEAGRYAFSRALRRSGFEVWEAASGAEALRLAARNPGLILLDVRLPDMTGFEVCRLLKTDPATASIPILQTSAAFTESSDKVQGLRGGADGYLVQPIEPDVLVATVHALLRVRQAEALAQALAAQWQTTFDAIGNAVCLVDADDRIDQCNEAFSGLVGLAVDKMVGRPFPEVFETAGIRDEVCVEAIRRRRQESREVPLGANWFRVSIHPIPPKGERAKVACVFSDVTASRYAEARLQRRNDDLDLRVRARTRELEEVNAQLESFCYSVSHDLRAPLRTLYGFSEILLTDHAGGLDAEGLRLLDRIRAAAGKMDDLTQDLLLFSTVSKTDLELEPVPLGEAVGEILSSHEEQFAAQDVSCRVSIPPGLSVRAHRATLRQAIWNLLSNAAKFVAPGVAPRIAVSAERRGDRVRLTIEDNGIGIALEYSGKIFDIFERIRPEAYPGTGIGLAIVRRAMERMGGAVGMEPAQAGDGSAFWIELAAGD